MRLTPPHFLSACMHVTTAGREDGRAQGVAGWRTTYVVSFKPHCNPGSGVISLLPEEKTSKELGNCPRIQDPRGSGPMSDSL
jgi:hypothetical protein